ncbi:MAG: hypothetical protein Tsb009_04400 [Planctomycetaceae bacterium]
MRISTVSPKHLFLSAWKLPEPAVSIQIVEGDNSRKNHEALENARIPWGVNCEFGIEREKWSGSIRPPPNRVKISSGGKIWRGPADQNYCTLAEMIECSAI